MEGILRIGVSTECLAFGGKDNGANLACTNLYSILSTLLNTEKTRLKYLSYFR